MFLYIFQFVLHGPGPRDGCIQRIFPTHFFSIPKRWPVNPFHWAFHVVPRAFSSSTHGIERSYDFLSSIIVMMFCFLPKGIADRNELGKDYKESILKYIPLLRNPLFNLQRAADFLEAWVKGTLQMAPLVPVSA